MGTEVIFVIGIHSFNPSISMDLFFKIPIETINHHHHDYHRPINMNIDTSTCIIQPKRRRLRHLNGIYLRNLATQPYDIRRLSLVSSLSKRRRDLKETIVGLETANERQVLLQKINNNKFLNSFFSLHYDEGNSPFYVSEICERSLNADFQEFDLKGLKISTEKSFVLKVWISTYEDSSSWKLLVDIDIKLSSLLYMNVSIDKVSTERENSIFVSLYDGIYLLPCSQLELAQYNEIISGKELIPSIAIPSFSYDLIMKLNNLQIVIEDLLRAKKKLSIQIESILDDSIGFDTFRIDKLKALITKAKEVNQQRKLKLEELKSLQVEEATRFAKLKQQRLSIQDNFEQIKENFSTTLIKHEYTIQELAIQRSQITKRTIEIFPKQDIQIWLGCKEFDVLPIDLNLSELSTLINTNDSQIINEVNASFGYISHIVYLLSRYLAIPLRYEVKPFGSTSYIVDRISQINQRKIFPLFHTNHYYRFQYGVILLNRNIKDLMKELYNF